MNKLLKEAIMWVFILIPYIYLATIWQQLPQEVPTHFDMNGTPNDWSDKSMLLFLPGGLVLFQYILMLVIPAVDPKKKIEQMGDRYYALRLLLTLFLSVLSVYILYVTTQGKMDNPNILLAIVGGLFAMLGNYFQVVRPNYFVGIRTPWTLENEEVWKKTHRLAGKLWTSGGALIVILALLLKSTAITTGIFITTTVLLALIPIIYSYVVFQKIKNSDSNA